MIKSVCYLVILDEASYLPKQLEELGIKQAVGSCNAVPCIINNEKSTLALG